MKREELLSSPQYWITKIQSQLYEEISNYLTESNMRKSDFAKKIKVSKGYISQILNGDFNHKLSKFVELSLAIGKVPIVNWTDLESIIQDEKNKVKTMTFKILSGGPSSSTSDFVPITLEDSSAVFHNAKIVNTGENHEEIGVA